MAALIGALAAPVDAATIWQGGAALAGEGLVTVVARAKLYNATRHSRPGAPRLISR